MNKELLETTFAQVYPLQGKKPQFFFAAGRVNLIGEHTDYNGGFVLPCAIQYGTWLAIRNTEDERISLASVNFDGRLSFSASLPISIQDIKWFNYPLGVMAQFEVGLGRKDHALFLNCHTLEYKQIPLHLDGYMLIIANTNKQRARHVISENQRVLNSVNCLWKGDLRQFGYLMNISHDSLKENYEVTGPELDTLVEEARTIEGVLGSRMTGAGFGGCTISLVKNNSVDMFIKNVGDNYSAKTGLKADFYIAEISDGVKMFEN
jgi:galactokinase